VVNEMASWLSGKLAKCQVDEMIRRRIFNEVTSAGHLAKLFAKT